MVDDATEGEEELLAQLAADPTLPASWAKLLTDEAEVLQLRSALHLRGMEARSSQRLYAC